jgi:hypothetical protein
LSSRTYSGITDLAKAAIHRRRDARRLFDPSARQAQDERYRQGAAYLAGYAIECKLKCIAMEVYGCSTLNQLIEKRGLDERSVYTHGLETLGAQVPALWTRFQRSELWPDFHRWVSRWRPSWRYSPRSMNDEDTTRFLGAVDAMSRWLEHNRD